MKNLNIYTGNKALGLQNSSTAVLHSLYRHMTDVDAKLVQRYQQEKLVSLTNKCLSKVSGVAVVKDSSLLPARAKVSQSEFNISHEIQTEIRLSKDTL